MNITFKVYIIKDIIYFIKYLYPFIFIKINKILFKNKFISIKLSNNIIQIIF